LGDDLQGLEVYVNPIAFEPVIGMEEKVA